MLGGCCTRQLSTSFSSMWLLERPNSPQARKLTQACLLSFQHMLCDDAGTYRHRLSLQIRTSELILASLSGWIRAALTPLTDRGCATATRRLCLCSCRFAWRAKLCNRFYSNVGLAANCFATDDRPERFRFDFDISSVLDRGKATYHSFHRAESGKLDKVLFETYMLCIS